MASVTHDGAVLMLDNGSVYSVDQGDQSTASSWSQGDSVSADNAGDSITDMSTGEKVAVTSVGDSSHPRIYVNTGHHTMRTKSDDGSIIVLEDGSIWVVALTDRVSTGIWLGATAITVNDSSGTAYPLVDTDDHESAEGNYVGQE